MRGVDYQKICQQVISVLPQRHQNVLIRRFGLQHSGKKETLQKIGNDFGITRERVRQIENASLSQLEPQKEKRYLKKVFFYLEKTLRQKGGVRREDILLEELGSPYFHNYVYFLLTLGDSFHRFEQSQELYSFWTIEKKFFQKIREIIDFLKKEFKKYQTPLKEEILFQLKKNKNKQVFLSAIEIAKEIEKGPLGDYGLISWPEIKPKGAKDKAYLVLKKEGFPLHFREIAKIANNFLAEFGEKKILAQTIHNELIKDKRFVLVGRGIYALKEWGYFPGTVKEIIYKILKEAKKPLSEEIIVKKVLTQRLVKENTILFNLQNCQQFIKNQKGKYILREN